MLCKYSDHEILRILPIIDSGFLLVVASEVTIASLRSELCSDFYLSISIYSSVARLDFNHGVLYGHMSRESDKEMAVSQRHPPADDKPSCSADSPDYLSSLPNEVLVKIISLLPETQDRVKLRYVSRRLQNISETPSLWREVVWRDCNSCEEERLHNVMKAHGIHIRRLSFSQHLIHPSTLPLVSQTTIKLIKVSEMAKMLHYCSNLTHLSLPVLDHLKNLNGGGDGPDDQLREAIQRIKCLEVLKVYCCGSCQPYLDLKMALKELTVHTIIDSEEDIKGFQIWMMNGFNPPILNVIVLNGNVYSAMIKLREFLLAAWPKWNVQAPTGHTACLRLYSNYKVPLSLFQNAPVFQLRYGETVTLPYVRATNVTVGVDDQVLLLTDHDDGSKAVHKARLYPRPSHTMHSVLRDHGQDNQLQLDNGVTNLTELDLSGCNIDIKPIVGACPQLQRLNLTNIRSLRLEELQVIATCCCNLQGLNLMKMRTLDNNFCMNLWETLGSMKLTHLSMDTSLFGITLGDVHKMQQLIALFKQCTTLQALELSKSIIYESQTYYYLLAHFPSLKYCRLINEGPTCTEHILTTCKSLRFFSYYVGQFSLSSAYNNLQQLCISSEHTDLNDHFMNTVSAHGGLIHVAFFVGSVTDHGITTLIKNSPNLLTFGCKQKRSGDDYLKSLGATLQKKFANSKLFTSGVFGLISGSKGVVYFEVGEYVEVDENVEVDEWLQNTELLSLWPPEQFYDMIYRY